MQHGRPKKVSGVILIPSLFAAVWISLAAGEEKPAAAVEVSMVRMGGEAESYWPRWRGPSGQGVVEETNYPDRWSDSENVVWKTPISGDGNSSPIVWGDRIFLTAAFESGQKRSILAFRRSDGRFLWRADAPDAEPEKPHAKNGYASGTPTTDGELVYTYFGNHGLMAVDFDGNVVWHRNLGEMNAYHGTACSPLLYEDRLVLYQDKGGRRVDGSFVAAFDKKTGRTLWETERRSTIGWGSPIAIRVGDRDEIIVSSQHEVNAYDPATGKELWRCAGSKFEVIPTPVVGHGMLFCSSGRAGPTLAIRPGGSGDVTSTHLVWQSPKGSPFVPSPLLYGDYLYMVNDMLSIATCYEARSGKLVWQGRMGEAQREGFSASPIGMGGKVFFTNDNGETFVLKAGPEFEVLHVNHLNEPTLASPALVDGKWYFRTARHLIAIGQGAGGTEEL